MPIVVNSNTTATIASFNLSHANDALRKSLARLSSGKRIVSPSDDAGGMAVAYKLNSKLKRTEAVQQNVQNGISYLQVQDGALSTIAKIADRMSELRTMASDITKNTGDVENYSKEFIELQRQLNQIRHEKFNGISLFATSQSPATPTSPELRPPVDKQGMTLDESGRRYAKFSREILTSADGVRRDGHVSINIVNLQYVLSIGQVDTRFVSTATATAVNVTGQTAETINGRPVYVNLGNVDNGNQDDFGGSGTTANQEIYTSDGYLKSILFVSMGSFTDIIGRIADVRAENGAEQNRLNMTRSLLIQNQTNLEAAHGRIMDADVALESTRFARQNVLVQSSAAMVAQANQLTSIALQILG
jgi:flagellin-like hook-associated protein FlgL